MSLPSVTFRSELPPVMRKELDQLDSELTDYLLTEHDDDGHHRNITASSIGPHTPPGTLAIKGPIAMTGPVTIDGQPIMGGGSTPAPHAATHSGNGTDPVNVRNLAGYSGSTAHFLRGDASFQPLPATTPTAHAATHLAGQSDAIDLRTLGGFTGVSTQFLAGDATFKAIPAAAPAAHHATHEVGGTDALVNAAWTNQANTFVPAQRFNNSITGDIWIAAASGYLERGRGTYQGDWIDVAYSAANFTGSGSMVWTVTSGNHALYAYALVGRTASVLLTLGGTTVSGATGSPLNVNLAGAFLPAKNTDALCFGQDNGVSTSVRVRIISGDPIVRLYRLDGANWAVSAGNTNLSLQFLVPI